MRKIEGRSLRAVTRISAALFGVVIWTVGGVGAAQPSGGNSPPATPSPREATPRPDPARPSVAQIPRTPPKKRAPHGGASRATAGPPTFADRPHDSKTARPQDPPKQTRRADSPKHEQKRKKLKKGVWARIERLARMVSFGTEWFLQYRYGSTPDDAGEGQSYNRFFVGRGYLTVKLKPTKWFQARITMDTHQDDTGDWKVVLKYLHGKFTVPIETKVVTQPFAEFGIVHTPWLDYEEHINYYRCQGTMFMERNKLFNSADLGLTVGTLLGRKLSKKFRKETHDNYPGTWGSMALGIYNGGGYHAAELNKKKTFEGRLSLRPLGFIHPNLQLSYFLIWGEGNVETDISKWQNHAFMASYAHKYFVVTAQYAMGRGNQKGSSSFVDTGGSAKEYWGASGFFELKLPWIWSSILGRYDYFNGPNPSGDEPYHRFIAAYAFHFWGRNKNLLMVDFDYAKYDGIDDAWAVTLTLKMNLGIKL